MRELHPFIVKCLSDCYQIEVTALDLLPVGADINASIYRIASNKKKNYFLKLKRFSSGEVGVSTLQFLQMAGVKPLILPVCTVTGKLAQQMGSFTFIVYPFVQGQDGFSCSLADEQWIALGQTLKQVHQASLPEPLKSQIRREDFSPKWRKAVRAVYARIGETASIEDEIALKVGRVFNEKRSIIQELIDRSEQLCQKISARSHPFVLCHGDIHGGNVLIDGQGAFYIVDWDEPVLAPKERDLMFIGGGVGNTWNDPREEKLFYQGYGQAEVDGALLAYYRCERIVEDIAVYGEELLFKSGQGKEREKMYTQFMDMFAPNGVVDIALVTGKFPVG